VDIDLYIATTIFLARLRTFLPTVMRRLLMRMMSRLAMVQMPLIILPETLIREFGLQLLDGISGAH